MDKFEKRLPKGQEEGFQIVEMNAPKIIVDGEGIETHGLIGCVSIAGSFFDENKNKNIAFMTHRGVQNVIENLSDAINIEEKNGLKKLPGTVFVFRQDEAIIPDSKYLVDGVIYNYQSLIARIKEALPHIFPTACIIEVRYGKKSRGEAGSAFLDLKNKKYKTDIEEGVF